MEESIDKVCYIILICRKSDFKKVAVCLTYPVEYPKNHILVEVKSKTLARKLLDGLEQVAENEAKTKHKNKPQVIPVLKFIAQFIDDNPLACCFEEVSKVKSLLNEGSTLKLSQKTSSMSLNIIKDKYFFKCKIHVPNDYPLESVFIDKIESNFPRVFKGALIDYSKCFFRSLNIKGKTVSRSSSQASRTNPATQNKKGFLKSYEGNLK